MVSTQFEQVMPSTFQFTFSIINGDALTPAPTANLRYSLGLAEQHRSLSLDDGNGLHS